MALLVLYFVLWIAVTDVLNVRLGVELASLMVVLAALVISRAPGAFFRDWWAFLLGLLLWNLSGPVAAQSPFPLHLDFMLKLDHALFLGRDPVVVVQHTLARPGHVTMLDWIAAATYNLHLPEPYIAGYLLWRLNRALYLQFAGAVLILLVLGFLTFILFPAIPPWLAAGRYGRLPGVFNGFGPVLRAHPLPFHGTPIFYFLKLQGDAVAAFPSEHAAFPMLEVLTFSRLWGRAWPLFLLWPLWVLFVVLYLGEHWLTDVLAGWLYALVIFQAVRSLTEKPSPAAL